MEVNHNINTYLPLLPYSQLLTKEFTQSSSIQGHIKSHSNTRLYLCDFPGCEKSFSQVFYLDKK